ncbi:uncharacterized protein B0I36DRAFT_363665 [Microdochium trichocladiopsis]|uniref:Uncharacterized protein n=1 Tax=Microdochium trichocladiopsis TaxID=1682393 RepID=A0A9P8Y3T5_9PEZI|nr:uncharacterized protein B0I36DRAFT_363665 [Microdochium trichocladiopsis]KAH7029072.1 hypothetical protein B0I36DRAFT_363665 [Microdochium trichocladiopsis]
MAPTAPKQAKGKETKERVKEQLDTHVFTFSGTHFKIPQACLEAIQGLQEEDDSPVLINTQAQTSGSIVTALKKHPETGKRPDETIFTLEEVNTDLKPDREAHLLVGFTLSILKPEDMTKRTPAVRLVGTTIPDSQSASVDLDDDNQFALPVVVNIKQAAELVDTGKKPTFYALAGERRGGLYIPHTVAAGRVFFLSLFRGPEETDIYRSFSWSRNVVARAADLILSMKPVGEGGDSFNQASNSSKVIVEAHRSLVAELEFHLGCFEMTSDVAHAKAALKFLEEARHDMKHCPPPSADTLSRFIDNKDVDWDDNDSQYVLSEARALWPEINLPEASTIATLKLQLVQGDVQVIPSQVPMFLTIAQAIACCPDPVQAGIAQGDGFASFVLHVTKHIKSPLLPKEGPTPQGAVRMMCALEEVLSKVTEAWRSFVKASREAAGDRVNAQIAPYIAEHGLSAADKDNVKTMLTDAYKIMHQEYIEGSNVVADRIETIVDMLKSSGIHDQSEEANGDGDNQ